MKHLFWGVVLGAVLAVPAAHAVQVESYVKDDKFDQIKISPTGEYFAATVPLEDGRKTALVIMRRSDNAVTATFMQGTNTHVAGFQWVNDERVLISLAEKFGALEQPGSTGELYGINADGSQADILVGQRVHGGGPGTRIQPKKVERIAAFLVDDLPADDRHVIISVSPFQADAFTDAERMDVYSGRRFKVASAPVRNASFVTDNRGVVRFAVGSGTDNRLRLYYRDGEGAPWELLNDQSTTGIAQWPVGFAADDRTAYLRTEKPDGPDAIVAYDIGTGSQREVLRDDSVDPTAMIYRNGTSVPVGAFFMDGRFRTEFFDDQAQEARLYRSLEAAFADQAVEITSRTADGRIALVQVWSDRNPGDFYLFDTVEKKAEHLLSRAEWLDPEQLAAKRPVQITARDGLVLHGYVSVPAGSSGKDLPTVVMPHGGPFDVRDTWAFDGDVQMLADAGYAVLQLNFRGSGGYGRAFTSAGARQWGQAMQDDLTDATHWLVEQGIASADRICIYGASYGAYAALMGAAREPDLYRCAAGYVGVYDLPTMHTHGDIQERGSGENYLREWLGERDSLAAFSPNRMADRIKIPVFLAAGGEDERAPVQHTRMMERSLIQAGLPVESLYYDNEGHGFYRPEHKREYYTRLLAFLARHLGGEPATDATDGAVASD